MTLVDWIPVITSGFVVFGGAVAYWNQKRLDQKKHLLELRRAAYQEFVDAMVSTVSAESRKLKNADEIFANFQRASGKMTIIASDEVLAKLATFQFDRTKRAIDDSPFELLLALRKDVFEGSPMTKQTIQNAFPIKFGD